MALVGLDLIDISKPLPMLGIIFPDRQVTMAVLAMVVSYSIMRMVIEWFQSDEARRKTRTSRIDFALSLAIPTLVVGWYMASQTNITALPRLPLLPAGVLVMIGLFTGYLLGVWVSLIPYIRSKQEARRLGLHRLPLALRATGRMTISWMLAVAVMVGLAPSFAPPLDDLWAWLVFIPAVFGPLSVVPSFLGLLKRQRFARLRQAFDWHDTMYQINGWDKPAEHDPSPMMKACTDGDLEAVKKLVALGAPIERAEHLGWTPLMTATAQQHINVAEFLLAKGANPNIANLLGRSPLSFAARYGNEALLTMLLKYGADPNFTHESFKEPPLHAAAATGNRPIVDLLLHAGANPKTRDVHKRTALELAEASGHGEIAALLRGV